METDQISAATQYYRHGRPWRCRLGRDCQGHLIPSSGCRQGDRDPVVATVELSAGCLVYPDDHLQTLCLHHTMRLTPRGTADLLTWDPAVVEILRRRYPEVG